MESEPITINIYYTGENGAARDKDRAEAFARKYGIDRAYGSYLDLVEDPDIDVVYISTTHNFHAAHAKDDVRALVIER